MKGQNTKGREIHAISVRDLELVEKAESGN